MEIIYYLHPCAKLSGEFICDNLVQKQMIIAGKVLSAACDCVCLWKDPNTYDEYVDSPFVDWCTESIDHVEWMRIYFETLVDIQERIHFQQVKAHKMIFAFKAAIKLFPYNGWVDPPINVPADCIEASSMQSYRTFYRKERLRIYKRVKKPYWFGQLTD